MLAQCISNQSQKPPKDHSIINASDLHQCCQIENQFSPKILFIADRFYCRDRGVGRNFRRGFPPTVDPRCGGLGAVR